MCFSSRRWPVALSPSWSPRVYRADIQRAGRRRGRSPTNRQTARLEMCGHQLAAFCVNFGSPLGLRGGPGAVQVRCGLSVERQGTWRTGCGEAEGCRGEPVQNFVASMIEFLFVILRHSNANFAKFLRNFPEVVELQAPAPEAPDISPVLGCCSAGYGCLTR